ncbi:MAG TPA: integrase arm-type DNA-binding domain-containing protein [Alphaproteobacteria bacterium]
MKLTDVACKTAKSNGKIQKLSDGKGLYLEVSPTGDNKYWRLKYRFGGKEKRLSLGVYGVVGLKAARDKVMAAKRALDTGIDPGAQKQEFKKAAEDAVLNSFEAMARAWHLQHKGRWADNTAHNNLHRLETDVFPVIGEYQIDKLTMQQILLPIRQIEARGAHELARRTLGLCSQVFRYAIVQGVIERNPLGEIKPLDILKPAKKGHFAAIESKELPGLIKAIYENKARLFMSTRLALELMMLTFVRTSELIEAKWDEFDLEAKTWLIPAERMKMRREHIVPLSDRAIAILNELKELSGNRIYVFTHVSDPRKHMSNNTILKALERLGYKGQMTGHGFRALAMSTIKEDLGYRHEVIDRQLAHAHRNKIDAAYDRAKFLPERRKMMQEWADYILKCGL